MKIRQEKDFKPVIIILESAEEVNALWDAFEGRNVEDNQQQMIINICNWFSNKLSL